MHFSNGLDYRCADKTLHGRCQKDLIKPTLHEHVTWPLEEQPTAFNIQLPFDLSSPVEQESMWFCHLFKALNSYCVFSILIFCSVLLLL